MLPGFMTFGISSMPHRIKNVSRSQDSSVLLRRSRSILALECTQSPHAGLSSIPSMDGPFPLTLVDLVCGLDAKDLHPSDIVSQIMLFPF